MSAAAVLAVGLAGLVGCSSNDGKSGESSTRAAGGGGAKAGAGQAVDVSSALQLVAKSTRSAATVRMRMTEKIPQLGTVTAAGVVGWKPMAMDLTMRTAGLPGAAQAGVGSVRMMLSGTTMYMNMGSKAAAQLQGKHWLKMDLAAVAKQQGAAGQQMLDQLNRSGQDPTESVGLITDSGDVKEVGKETVDGVPTTHYRGTVNVSRLTEKQGGGMTAAQRKQIETLMTKLGVTTVDVDLWVNAENRPVRMHETGRTTAGRMDVMVDYSDYGTPLRMQAPPASDTLDMAAMLKGLGKSSGQS